MSSRAGEDGFREVPIGRLSRRCRPRRPVSVLVRSTGAPSLRAGIGRGDARRRTASGTLTVASSPRRTPPFASAPNHTAGFSVSSGCTAAAAGSSPCRRRLDCSGPVSDAEVRVVGGRRPLGRHGERVHGRCSPRRARPRSARSVVRGAARACSAPARAARPVPRVRAAAARGGVLTYFCSNRERPAAALVTPEGSAYRALTKVATQM